MRVSLIAFLLLWLAGPPVMAVTVVPEHPHRPVSGMLLQWRLEGVPPEWLRFDSKLTPRIRIHRAEGDRHWAIASFLMQAHDWPEDSAQAVAPPVLAWRFAAPAAGVYRWRLLPPADDPDSERTLASGQFLVAAAEGGHGPLRQHPHNPRLLADHRGRAMIAIGPNIAWAITPDRLGRMERYLDRLQAVGGTHFRLWCASWMGQIGDPDDGSRLRLDQADLLDRVLVMAEERALFVTVVLDNHHDYQRGFNGPFGATVAERYEAFFAVPLHPAYRLRLDYMLARYAAHHHILAWEVMNELDYAIRAAGHPGSFERRVNQAHAWLIAAADYLRRNDPHGHLITSSCAQSDAPQLIVDPVLDLVQIHQYVPPMVNVEAQHKDGAGLLASHLERLQAAARPFAFSEVGFHGTNEENSGHQRDRDGVLLRQLAWAGLLLGGYGSGMNWWWDVYIDEHELWSVYRPLAAAVARIDWDDPDLEPLGLQRGHTVSLLGWRSPTQALLWPHLYANTWDRQLGVGREPDVYEYQHLIIEGLRPNTAYAQIWIDLGDGGATAGDGLVSNASGRALLALPVGRAESAVLLRAE